MESEKLTIGSIVQHSNEYHVRGASTGTVEAITDQGWYRVFWEEDNDRQITAAFRTYEAHELLVLTDDTPTGLHLLHQHALPF